MVSLRFPTAAIPRLPPSQAPNGVAIAATVAAAAAAAAAVAASLTLTGKSTGRPVPHPAPLWASLSLADAAAPSSVEPRTGATFPTEAAVGRRLLGIGLRKTSVLGLKSIDVYAFGVYADDNDLKQQLKEKYSKFSVSELKGNAHLRRVWEVGFRSSVDKTPKSCFRALLRFSRMNTNYQRGL
uniref:Chalcone-flavonone isomerase family protein n=1 Tax=Zea mays TaxID=4577 RepID=A0A804MS19_MAIZE